MITFDEAQRAYAKALCKDVDTLSVEEKRRAIIAAVLKGQEVKMECAEHPDGFVWQLQ